MKIHFESKTQVKILEEIKKEIETTPYKNIIHLSEEKGFVNVKIKKLGTSELYFSCEENKDKKTVEWHLFKEKIAFTHKAYKSEVLEHINKIIRNIGGKIDKT